jgi:hypothetical protein
LRFPGGQLSLQLWIIQKTSCFVSSYDPIEKRPIIVSTIDQVTADAHAVVTLVSHKDAWNTVLGDMRHIQVIKQNFVASTMANILLLLLLLLQFHLPFGSGWHTTAFHLLGSRVQF